MQNRSLSRDHSQRDGGGGGGGVDEEQLRTLWCGGVAEKVDEEILYELFQNAGPLERVTIPRDKETKRKKNFAFIVFQHAESTQYAFDLLNGTELFRQAIRLQNKETGLGMGGGGMGPPSSQHSRHDSREQQQQDGRGRGWGGGGGGHQRSFSTPAGGLQFGNHHQQHQQQQVWANNGYNNQQHQQYQQQQYQAPYGYGGYNMQGNGGSPQLQQGRDRESRGHREQEERNRREYSHGRDRRDHSSHGRDRSYDRYQSSRR